MRSPIVLVLLAGLLLGTVGSATARPAARPEQRIVLTVTQNGFEPDRVRVRAGRPVTLVVTRTVERTCATDIVIKAFGVRKPLPLDRPVEVRFTPKRPGVFRYACAMDMIAGHLVVE